MGEEWAGRVWRRIREAEHEARREGDDIHLAVAARVERMRRDAKGLAKKDLRLWSPACYEPGGRRESRYVRHLSCLVLDYDEGLPIDWATEEWKNYLHIVHTTFSHSAETPKFRIVLPLALPVIAEDWGRFWTWGQHRAGMAIDPAPSAPSSTYALPATPNEKAPRLAHINDGPLLDPMGEGVVTRTAQVPPQMVTDPHSHFHGGAPDHDYIQLKRGSDLEPLNDPDELDEAFEEMF